MNATTTEEMRDDYLRRLDAAISEIPHGLAVELRAGIAEELRGTNLQALETRIRDLGTPEEVAQAAIEAGFGGSPQSTPPLAVTPAAPAANPAATPATISATSTTAQSPAQLPLVETRGYAITSAIILGIGGVVIPFVGWIIGAILVTNSKLWSAGEKAWAILFPPLAIDLGAIIGFAIKAATEPPRVAYRVGAEIDPSAGSGINPLVPATFDLVWSVLLVAAIVAPFTAVWLILRLRGRKVTQK